MRTLVTTLALVLLAGCGAPADEVAAPATSAPETSAPATEPSEAEPTPADTATAAPADQGPAVELWFVREVGNEVFVEPERHALDAPTQAVARGAIEALLRTPPRDPGLRTLLPEGTRLLDVNLRDGILTVDLDLPRNDLGSYYEALMFGQVVHTGTQFASVRRVRFLKRGEPATSGHLDLSEPLRPDETAVSPIVITSPAHGQEVAAGDVTIAGTANVFEANVTLRLLDPSGDVVEETFTTATCGTGCRGDWEHTFTDVTTPGEWTIEASEDDASGGEGPPPFRVQRTFVVN